jgi:hypothetical protein
MLHFRSPDRPKRRSTDESPWGRVRRELRGLSLRRTKPGADSFHPTWCTCRVCELHRDPTRAQDRAIGQLQAGLLLAFLILFYGVALFLAPAIAGSFGWGL